MARSILWCMHLIGLKSIKGKYDHISKCWTLISNGRSCCPSILYCANTYINSIILILQCLPLYRFLQLDSVLWTGLLISKGKLQSLLPYLIKCSLADVGSTYNRNLSSHTLRYYYIEGNVSWSGVKKAGHVFVYSLSLLFWQSDSSVILCDKSILAHCTW